MAESTTPSRGSEGYGYLWWLHGDGSYSAFGIFGQLIHVDPARRLVVATHGAWPVPTGSAYSSHRAGALDAIKRVLGGRPPREGVP